MAAPRVGLVFLALLAAAPAAAQREDELQAAMQLERQGRVREAAVRFALVLEAEPGHTVALLGLERTLEAAGEIARVLPYVARALDVRPDEPLAHGVELRALASLQRDAELAAAAERWVAAAPQASDPYREWAFLLARRGNLTDARRVLERGHERLGGAALQPELAQLAVAAGRWTDAARHWHAATRADPPLAQSAGMSLGQARPSQRAAVLQVLLGELGDETARRMAADAMLAWGRAGEAWALLDANLPANPQEAMDALRQFADRARLEVGPDGARARGYALERLARYQQGAAAQRSRIEAARAFADAGDRNAAERMLGEIARDPATAPRGTSDAMVDLIALMAETGQPADAERRLDAWRETIPEGVVEDLRRKIAGAWAGRGEFERAERLIAADSSVGAAALRGWIALYRGNLLDAVEQFRLAGPFAGSRDEATRRTEAAALAQRLAVPDAREVGEAFLALARGDTARAVTGFADAARAFPPNAGRADLLVFAGRLALDRSDDRAATLYTAALAADPVGATAPSAEYGLAVIAWRADRPDEARQRLERVILDHPESAVVPQARRLLDQIRGGVPNS